MFQLWRLKTEKAMGLEPGTNGKNSVEMIFHKCLRSFKLVCKIQPIVGNVLVFDFQ